MTINKKITRTPKVISSQNATLQSSNVSAMNAVVYYYIDFDIINDNMMYTYDPSPRRVPEDSTRDCAESPNNCVPRRAKLSTDVT